MAKDKIDSNSVLSTLSKSAELTGATNGKQELTKITSAENDNAHELT